MRMHLKTSMELPHSLKRLAKITLALFRACLRWTKMFLKKKEKKECEGVVEG